MDQLLVAGLKQARSAKSTSPSHFALIMKGSTSKLLVSKKKPGAKDISGVKEEVGGGTVVQGTCFGDGGELVFETEKAPAATWAAAAKSAAKTDAGLTLSVRFQKAGAADNDSSAESEGEED